MATQKAGLFLINKQTKCIALIYRENHKDYTFPKGHLEKGESLLECAVRETAEETKREAKVITSIPPVVGHYTTSSGEECECHMYVAIDQGKSNNTSTDTHTLIWTPVLEVEEKLSYESLKLTWKKILPEILKLI